ncbi:MAG: hypothetical protein KGP35_05980 [Bacteroidetes bacterium]|nr:hypothetical protein [Bacteroidota bacterium]
MLSILNSSQIGTKAVRKLREEKLRNGLPFMINDLSLSSDECYLEFPDGSIKLVISLPEKRTFDIKRELTPEEIRQIRIVHQLPL